MSTPDYQFLTLQFSYRRFWKWRDRRDTYRNKTKCQPHTETDIHRHIKGFQAFTLWIYMMLLYFFAIFPSIFPVLGTVPSFIFPAFHIPLASIFLCYIPAFHVPVLIITCSFLPYFFCSVFSTFPNFPVFYLSLTLFFPPFHISCLLNSLCWHTSSAELLYAWLFIFPDALILLLYATIHRCHRSPYYSAG